MEDEFNNRGGYFVDFQHLFDPSVRNTIISFLIIHPHEADIFALLFGICHNCCIEEQVVLASSRLSAGSFLGERDDLVLYEVIVELVGDEKGHQLVDCREAGNRTVVFRFVTVPFLIEEGCSCTR